MTRLDQLKNLLLLAAADGSLNESEIKLLGARCRRWGIDDAQFAEAIEYALKPDAELVIPPRVEDREALLRDMLRVMAADGRLAESEKDLFALAAATMGVSRERLDALIDSLVDAR